MSESFDVKVEVPEGLESGAVLLSEEVNTALRNSGLSIEGAAKKLVHKATSNLKRSIVSSVVPLGDTPRALVSAQAKYAAPVEYGSKPHTPPIEPLKDWVRIKWGATDPKLQNRLAGALWMTIRRKGTKAHPFMRPAFDAKRESVMERMKKAVAKAVERMRG